MNEIFIDFEDDVKKIYIVKDYEIVEKHSEKMDKSMLEGNIYIGKVQNVLPGMQAAFVRIGNHKNGFIHLKELLPKQDICGENENIEQKSDIRKLIKPGDSIIVQVTRDENSKKGARLTSHISLNGRFFIYMPNTPFVAISQKIEDDEKKEKLKNLITNNIPENTGGIIRTNAANVKEEEILAEVKKLCDLWENIKKMKIEKVPMELYNAGGIISKCLIDNLDRGLEKIYVRNNEIKEKIENFLRWQNVEIKVEILEDYLKKFDYEKQLRKIENRKIWLKCGGFITIDKTEALTAIDVNSGKFTGKDNFEKTVFEVNKEATIEIAKQLRLRNIGGIIIIDYIDMHIEENKRKILELIENEIKKDSSKVQIEGFTKLNLLELTRKHAYSI